MPSSQPTILLIGSGVRTSLENIYLRAFNKLGYDKVELFDTEPIIPKFFRQRIINRLIRPFQNEAISRKLIEHFRTTSKCYNVIVVFKGMPFSPSILNECRKLSHGALWININPDDPYNTMSSGASNSNIVESIPFYDLYCIWSRGIVDRLRNNGARKAMYLPFGFDEEIHRPVSGLKSNGRTVSFVGTWDHDRESKLMTLVGYDLEIYGNCWNRVNSKSPLQVGLKKKDLFGDSMARVIGESAVSLNFLRPQNIGSHNMRTFEIPACRGMMLADRTVENNEFFEEGVEADFFSSKEELTDKLNFYLCNESIREKIALQGFLKCHNAGYSYTSRVASLIRELGLVP